MGPERHVDHPLVDIASTPMLIKSVQSGALDPGKLVTHRFAMDDIMKAYDTFSNGAKPQRLESRAEDPLNKH